MSHPNPDSPITDFSQCHVGIFRKLDLLGELPALIDPAERARETAGRLAGFFREAIFEHHLDEERELFPAVIAHAQPGPEREQAQALASRLVDEHRDLEQQWSRIEPLLRQVAKGEPVQVDAGAIERFDVQYRAHARFEEREFLPLAQTILERNASHLAALGLSLHIRHAFTEVVSTYY